MKTRASEDLLICLDFFFFFNANRHEISFSFSTVWVGGHLEKGGGGVSPSLHPRFREFPRSYPVCDPGNHIKCQRVGFSIPHP